MMTTHQALWALAALVLLLACIVAVTSLIRAMRRHQVEGHPVAIDSSGEFMPLPDTEPITLADLPQPWPLISLDVEVIAEKFRSVAHALDEAPSGVSTMTSAMAGLAEAVDKARRDSGRWPHDPRVPERGRHARG